jgi:prepilin-type N-terminal cleavage/methylation domain-containing protein
MKSIFNYIKIRIPCSSSKDISKRSAGFTLIEVLTSLFVMGLLMAAMAVAFEAAANSYTEHDKMYRAMAAARGAMLRMTSQIRTAHAVDESQGSNICSIITDDGSDITYSYNSTENKLYYITNDITTDQDYILCENVTDASFTKATAVKGMQTIVRNVQISLEVTVEGVSQKISTGAVVRKNLPNH